jgi:hypothetical protein
MIDHAPGSISFEDRSIYSGTLAGFHRTSLLRVVNEPWSRPSRKAPPAGIARRLREP